MTVCIRDEFTKTLPFMTPDGAYLRVIDQSIQDWLERHCREDEYELVTDRWASGNFACIHFFRSSHADLFRQGMAHTVKH